MMTKPIDASRVSITGRKVLFDTNIWLMLNGFSNPAKLKTNIYSEAHSALIKNENTIVINDYVLGEFCNRSCKLEYEAHKAASDEAAAFPYYKAYRKSKDFLSVMESVRDTCLNILDECEFVAVGGGHYKITDVIGRYCDGSLDFTDLILSDYCASESIVLMTDDADYVDCGVEIITANNRLLGGGTRR